MTGSFRRQDVAVIALLGLLTAAVFGQTIYFGFIIIDDPVYVSRNEHIAGGVSLAAIRWALSATYASNWHPLTWISHMLDIEIYGLAPGGHHFTNLLLHVVNTALLYAALRGMTGAQWPSAVVAALFAVHPLHVESVAWIAERKDVLAAFFWLVSLILHLRYARRPRAGRYVATLIAFALGLTAKSVLVTLPFALLLLDWWPLGRMRPQAGSGLLPPAGFRPLVVEKVPFLVAALAVSGLTYRAQAIMGAIDPFPLGTRLSNAAVSYMSYLGKTVWPAGLAVFYPHPAGPWPVGRTAAAVALLLVCTTGALLAARRRPWLVAGWFWYLGTMVPMAGFIQVGGQAMADRYTYLPLIGVFLAAAWTFAVILGNHAAARGPFAGVIAAVIAALAVVAWFQTRLWRDDLLLCRHAAEVAPGNWVAHNSLASRFAEIGQPKEAEAQFRLALESNPDYFGAHANYALLLFRLGRLAEARKHAARGMELNSVSGTLFGLPALLSMIADTAPPAPTPGGGSPEELFRTGDRLAREGKDAAAIAAFEAVLSAEPGRAAAHNNIGILYARLGNLERAIERFRRAIALQPSYAEARYNLGNALFAAGRFAAAADAFGEALRLKPDAAGIANNLGVVQERLGRPAEAAASYREALRLDPGNANAHANLERLEAARGRPEARRMSTP